MTPAADPGARRAVVREALSVAVVPPVLPAPFIVVGPGGAASAAVLRVPGRR